jgi:NAD(P)H dehydrogenase (quinone)
MTTRTDDISSQAAVSSTVHACVVYYSSTGNIHAIAEASVEGAVKAGAEVRLRRVAETAPRQGVDRPSDRADQSGYPDSPAKR